MPRTHTLLVALALLAQVQLAPLPGGKLNPRAAGCPPYTRWDPSADTCVVCDNPCLAGEELREDCGYSKEGYPVDSPCRQCPNGTYSPIGGQKQCQDCKLCSSGYQQECTSKQPAVCFCEDDEELSPDGTACQKICCFCQYEPSIEDTIDDCHYRYPGTKYYCKKGSLSTGETCKRPPQPTTTVAPPPVSTAAPLLTTVKPSSTPNKTEAPPLAPTQPVTAEPSRSPKTTAHTSGKPPSSTAMGMSTVTPTIFPVSKGKQPTMAIVLGTVAGCAVICLISCRIRHWRAQKAETAGEDQDQLLPNVAGLHVCGGGNEDAGTEDKGEDRGGILVTDAEDPDKEVDSSGGGDSGNVSKESSDTGSHEIRESPFSSEDSLRWEEATSLSSADSQGDEEASSSSSSVDVITHVRTCLHTTGLFHPFRGDIPFFMHGNPGSKEIGGTSPKGDEEADSTEENEQNEASDEETSPKDVVPEGTMEFSERIEGPPNDEKGRNALPSGGGGPNRANQQQPGGGQPPQPPPYPGPQRQDGQPAVNISGGTFHASVTIVVQGNNSQYHAAPGMGGQGQGAGNGGDNGNAANGAAPRQADGRRQQPADRTGPNNAATVGNQRAATLGQNDRQAHGNGTDRVGNRRHQGIQVNIRPNLARLGQNVRFSCILSDNLDPTTCEFRWMKQGQLHRVCREQNFHRTIQRCDAGVYTCEVTTPGGDVLEGQAELYILEDDAEGGVDMPGPNRRPRDNDDDQPTRKRPRTSPCTSGAQGFSNPSGQIQVPDVFHQMALEAILNEEDLFYNLRIKLEQSDQHYRNIGSHFGLTHSELNFLEFTELRGKDSPLKAILNKIAQSNKNITVGDLLTYCNDQLKRRDVVKTVVQYFEEKEQENLEMQVKEEVTNVTADSHLQLEECCKKDNKSSEMKEQMLKSTAIDEDVCKENASEQSSAQEKSEICELNRGAIELVDMQS